jgi:hypothetical protein
MGIDAKKVYVPKPVQNATTGAIQIASVGITAPTDARSVLSTGWEKSLGYVSSDGVTISGIMAAGDALRDWSQSSVRTLDGQASPTVAIPAMQVDETLASILTTDYSTDAATTEHGGVLHMSFAGGVGPEHAYAFNMADEGRRLRIFCPNGQVTNIDDISLVPTGAVMFGTTISLNADDTGHFIYFFFDDGQVTSA